MELKGLGAELWKADALPNLEGDATLEKYEDAHDFEELAPLVDRVLKWNCMKGEAWMADDFDAPLVDFPKPDTTKTPKPGCMKGRIWMADDFDAPMEEFEEYM